MYILPDGFISNLTVGLSRRGIDGSDLSLGNTGYQDSGDREREV
jgi:hypothetical protein